MVEFPNLFSPIRVNRIELKNRIVMTATHLGYNAPGGDVSDRLVGFYEERAKGGIGLIIVGGCPVDDHVSMRNMMRIDDDRYVAGLKRLTCTVKTAGAKIAAQIYQAGRYVHSSMIGGRTPFSASEVPSALTGETPRALELEEISLVQEKFAEAALRAKKAGFDAVEIHAAAGYLISQFLSPVTNKREDRYGGPIENRIRFGLEVVDRTRKAVGPDYPIVVRLSGHEFMNRGNGGREAKRFAKALEEAGCDLLNVTVGWHESRVPQLTTFVPRGCFVYAAQRIKSSVSIPVLACNRINDPPLAEAILQRGSADMIAMTRAVIADPDFPNKALGGKKNKIYHCVACNQGCFDNIFKSKPVACLVNPRVGVEGETRIVPSGNPKKIIIIGGGPAGMKAACTAAERGHKVFLVEKSDRLGGQLLLNRNIPGREEMATVV
ncbi:MAG: FAD-dependent oxidoreductase [Deltaproteobacteria bacterium]|nr:FAD-dependent oxidoreductase [Deltaproteobacteria bacterium]